MKMLTSPHPSPRLQVVHKWSDASLQDLEIASSRLRSSRGSDLSSSL
jgi:hypothetical protein